VIGRMVISFLERKVMASDSSVVHSLGTSFWSLSFNLFSFVYWLFMLFYNDHFYGMSSEVVGNCEGNQ